MASYRRMKVVKAILLLMGLGFYCHDMAAQSNDWEDSVRVRWQMNADTIQQNSAAKKIREMLQPELISDVQNVRAYIRTQTFHELCLQYDDVSGVDFIYLHSLEVSDHDIQRALAVSFLAVLEHRIIYIKTPFPFTIPIPLTFESDSSFAFRVRHLPKNIYPDSPGGKAGDRDKLQHFFGSAFLSYALHQPEAVQWIGDVLEWAEPGLVVGGANDPRDKRANLEGEQFGRDLLLVQNLLPSDYLTLPYKDRK